MSFGQFFVKYKVEYYGVSDAAEVEDHGQDSNVHLGHLGVVEGHNDAAEAQKLEQAHQDSPENVGEVDGFVVLLIEDRCFLGPKEPVHDLVPDRVSRVDH